MAEFIYEVTKEDSGKPLKTIVRQRFTFSSRLMTKLKQQNLILVNEEPLPGWITVQEGDRVKVLLPEEESDFPPEDIPIQSVYEDSDLIVINKQPGTAVHPTKGKPYHTIANGLMKRMQDRGESYKIRFVNRLDMNTSGLLIVAKNSHVQDILVKQMKNDEVVKKYLAILEGVVGENGGRIEQPLGRPDPNEVERWIVPEAEGGYASSTNYRVIERIPCPHFMKWGDSEREYDGYTLTELKLDTGRTHQIRIHMASIGHPVTGDHLYCHGDPFEYRRIYGDSRPPLDGTKGPRMDTNPEVVSEIIERQALHAYFLEFDHPITGEHLSLRCDLPEDMRSALEKAKK